MFQRFLQRIHQVSREALQCGCLSQGLNLLKAKPYSTLSPEKFYKISLIALIHKPSQGPYLLKVKQCINAIYRESNRILRMNSPRRTKQRCQCWKPPKFLCSRNLHKEPQYMLSVKILRQVKSFPPDPLFRDLSFAPPNVPGTL